jgi:hypothetical protein
MSNLTDPFRWTAPSGRVVLVHDGGDLDLIDVLGHPLFINDHDEYVGISVENAPSIPVCDTNEPLSIPECAVRIGRAISRDPSEPEILDVAALVASVCNRNLFCTDGK